MFLPIANPCPADWNAMRGDTQARFCGICQKHVYNLSEMTECEARGLLARIASPCVRYRPAQDGSVMFRTAAILATSLLVACAPETQCPAGTVPIEVGANTISDASSTILESSPSAPDNTSVIPEATGSHSGADPRMIVGEPIEELQGELTLPSEPPIIQGGISPVHVQGRR